MVEIVSALLVVSLILNALLAFYFFKKPKALTQDAKALLAEILSGSAVVKIQVLDPSGLFYRSPRG